MNIRIPWINVRIIVSLGYNPATLKTNSITIRVMRGRLTALFERPSFSYLEYRGALRELKKRMQDAELQEALAKNYLGIKAREKAHGLKEESK